MANKKLKKQDKKREEANKLKMKEEKQRMEDNRQRREGIKAQIKQKRQFFEADLREKDRQIREKEQELKEKKLEDLTRDQQMKFNADLENYAMSQSKQGKDAIQKRKEQEEIEQKLKGINDKTKHGTDLYQQFNTEKQKLAEKTIKQVEEVNSRMNQVEYHFDLEKMHQGFKRIQKSEKLKKDTLKARVDEIRSNREQKMTQALTNHRNLKMQAKDKYNYLQDKDQQRSQLIQEIKEALQEDVEQKKEISLLKKKDQLENLERGKNFHQLYKQKLVERILEKKERAERVKNQQKRIADMCGTQRVRVNRPFSTTGSQIVIGTSAEKAKFNKTTVK